MTLRRRDETSAEVEAGPLRMKVALSDITAIVGEEASKKRVGDVKAVFFQVPLIVVPFVAIQAVPLPMTCASRRCLCEPSLSGPKCISITTTFFGATRWPVAASICFFSPVTDRR